MRRRNRQINRATDNSDWTLVERLLALCDWLQVPLEDLVGMARHEVGDDLSYLSDEQETYLAADDAAWSLFNFLYKSLGFSANHPANSYASLRCKKSARVRTTCPASAPATHTGTISAYGRCIGSTSGGCTCHPNGNGSDIIATLTTFISRMNPAIFTTNAGQRQRLTRGTATIARTPVTTS